MNKLKQQWKNAGFANISLLIAALILYVFFYNWSLFSHAATGLVFLWLGLNWQAAKQSTNVDEWVEKQYKDIEGKVNKVADEAEIKYKQLKLETERKYEELEKKFKDFVNEQVKPFKD